ncbi:MAG: FtsX-like permease family protein [Deltaproteobacteria bacterium]|nr:FtsX-like permease family protein [Deltaproteobacteria bacterium]MBW2153177.1 FtsX-like permease family protein [Deltaproteobacteria bacterium]
MRYLTFSFRLFVWFCLRNLRNHPGRTVAVLFGIALGAAVFTSVRLSIHASLNSFIKSMNHITGSAQRVLVRPGGYVPESLITKVLNHPAIESASPFLTTYIKASTDTDNLFLLIGIDPVLDRAFRNWNTGGSHGLQGVVWLDLMKEPYTIIIGEPLARRLGCKKNDMLTLEHTYQKTDFRVLEILTPDGLSLVEGGYVALTDIATFQEFTGLYGLVDRIDLRFNSPITQKDMEAFKKTLPDGILLASPSTTRDSGQKMIGSYQLNLSILSFASLFVGMFLVYSLVAINATSRRKEIAILRSIGTSGNLIFVLFLSEGALFGIVGWVVALPISAILIKFMLGGISETISTLFVRVSVDRIYLAGWEVILSFGVTFITAVVAALQPAREATQVAPKEALGIIQQGMKKQESINRLALTGLLFTLLVPPISTLPDIMGMPLAGYIAMFLLFLGFSLMIPWLIERLGNAVSPLLRRMFGVSAYMAGCYVRDSGTRTAVSVGALMTAIALFGSLVIMINSFRKTVELWVHQTINGDLFLTPKLNEANQFRLLIDQRIVDGLQNLDKHLDVVTNRRFFLIREGIPYEFEVLDMEVFFRHGDYFWMKGDPDRVRPMVEQGEGVLVSEVFSNRTGLTIGDFFQEQIEDSFVKLPILGIVRDYRTQGGVVFYSKPHFKNRYHHPGSSGVRVYFKQRNQDLHDAVRRLQKEIITLFGDRFDMISGSRLRQSILRVFDETFAITSVLLLIALIIAALGIATTLTVLVMDRSHQLNTLLAVGAGYGQIRSMIFWEAAFLVVVGELSGTACGFVLSYILVYVINKQSFGWTFLYRVDWSTLGMSVPLIVLTALAAALPAIKLIFRQPPAILLREG